MARRIIAAVAQMNSSNDPGQNFLQATTLVQRAVTQFHAQLVCLPENFAFIGESYTQSLSISQSLNGPIIENYKSLASENKVWLSLGGFQRKVEDKQLLRNTHLIISPEGQIVSEYAKIHLFDVDLPYGLSFKESLFTQPGDEVVVAKTPIGKLGLSVVSFTLNIIDC